MRSSILTRSSPIDPGYFQHGRTDLPDLRRTEPFLQNLSFRERLLEPHDTVLCNKNQQQLVNPYHNSLQILFSSKTSRSIVATLRKNNSVNVDFTIRCGSTPQTVFDSSWIVLVIAAF